MKRIVCLVVLIFSFIYCCNDVLAYKKFTTENVQELVNSHHRNAISLVNGWTKSYDNQVWQDAVVPYSEQTSGRVIYKNTIKIEKDFISRYNLHIYFPGISGEVEFYFNDELINKYDGEALPIQLEIPHYFINVGNNELKIVFLENSKLINNLLMSSFNAPLNVKGIIREPFLITTSKVWISDIKYKFIEAGNSTNLDVNVSCAAGEIVLNNQDSTSNKVGQKKTNIQVEYKLINKHTGSVVAAPESRSLTVVDSRTSNVKFRLNCSELKRWEIDAPELYVLDVTIKSNNEVLDEYFVNVGVKNLKISKNSVRLNGESIKLKAVTYHEYFYSTKNTLSAYRMEKDIKNIKVLGANAIRLTKAPHPYLAYLCDKYGLLMFIDLPLNNTPNSFVKNEEMAVKCRNILVQLLNNYQKFSSFVAIGLGSEVEEGAAYAGLINSLSEVVSNSKLLKYKYINLYQKDFTTDGFDFMFINLFGKKFNYENISTALKEKYDMIDIPIFFSISSAVNPSNFNGYKDRTSIEYQAYFLKNCYNIANAKSINLPGTLINSYNDYETEYPLLTLNYYNQFLQTSGLVDVYHVNRLSYSVVKSLFNDEKVPLLNAGNYESESPNSYIIVGLLFTAIMAFMLNRYRRFREYVVRAFLRPYNFYADIRDNRILSLSQTVLLGFIISVSFALCLASIVISLRYNIEYNYLFTTLFPYKDVLNVIFISAWHPIVLLLLLIVLVFLHFVIISAIVSIISKFVKTNVHFDKSFTITIWSALPYIILLPIGVFIARILNVSPNFISFFTVILLIVFIVVFFRYMKALSVVFDKPIIKIYMVMTVAIAICVLLPFIFYENSNEVLVFINYFRAIP